jgi:flagellar basal-body rod protein FlgF
MIYLGMIGAKETAEVQGLLSNNLANANTTGFRADLERLRSVPVFGDGQPSRAAVQGETPASDFSPSAPIATDRELDVAIQGEGWIAVQAPDGNEAYTRAGDLRLSAGGILTTASGHPVLGNDGPVALPPVQKLEIGTDGTVSATTLGEDNLVVLDRIKLTRPPESGLTKGRDGLFRLGPDEAAPADASVRLVSGAIESSNVNAIETLVDIIGMARLFELQVKVMKEAEDTDAATTKLISNS